MKISRTIALFIWMIASIFYAYQYVLRVMPSIMLNDIIQQFHINAIIFGQFSGAYYIGYSLIHIPIGLMLDRYGPRKIMSGCILLTVIGLLPIIFAEHWIYPVIGRVLIGIGSSAAILGLFKIIRTFFEERRFTRMLSIAVTIGLIGAIYGGGPVKYMCTVFGYKAVIEIFAALGLALSIITYYIVPEINMNNKTTISADIKAIFCNYKIVLLCCCAGLMVGPLEGFADVWGSVFLQQVYGINTSAASYLPSMIFLGMCFGAPFLSLIAEKTGYYIGTVIGAGIIMCATFTVLIISKMSISMIFVSFVLVGICCAYQIIAIYKASTYSPVNIAGLATSVANMIIMLFGYAFHTTIGYLVDIYGGVHNANALIHGVGVIPIALGIGAFGLLIMAYYEKRV